MAPAVPKVYKTVTKIQYYTLLSNYSEYRPNNDTNIQQFCTVENLFVVQVGVRTQNVTKCPLSLINLLTTVRSLGASTDSWLPELIPVSVA